MIQLVKKLENGIRHIKKQLEPKKKIKHAILPLHDSLTKDILEKN